MPSRRHFLLGATAGTAGLATGAVGHATAGTAGGATEADVGFCVDMTMHHVQALAMCQRVLGRDTGGSVQAAASEVLQNQAIEVGMMRAWLADWDESTATPDTVMAWMHDGVGMAPADMPGYATSDQLRELSLADGLEQGRMWLELMRAHHVGGVAMADAALSLAASDKVLRLARLQSAVQSYEITQYDLLLNGEYASVSTFTCELETTDDATQETEDATEDETEDETDDAAATEHEH